MALMLAVGAVMMLCLHESPKFLANRGHVDKALSVLKSSYGLKGNDADYVVSSLLICLLRNRVNDLTNHLVLRVNTLTFETSGLLLVNIL